MMKFAVLAFAALASVASAADCNLVTLAQAAGGANSVQCNKESGYVVTSVSMPTDAQLKIMCFSTACKGLLADLKTAAPSECQVTLVTPSVALYASLLNPIQAKCDALTTASTPSTTTAAPTSTTAAPTSTTATPTVTDATSC